MKLTAKKVNMQNIETNKDIAVSVVAFVASGIELIQLNWVDEMYRPDAAFVSAKFCELH